jgi:hypothetical protein
MPMNSNSSQLPATAQQDSAEQQPTSTAGGDVASDENFALPVEGPRIGIAVPVNQTLPGTGPEGTSRLATGRFRLSEIR